MPTPPALAALLAILVAGATSAATDGARRDGSATIRAEPEASFLVDGPTYEAVVADLDADGVRDIVALTGTSAGAMQLEAWHLAAEAWQRLGEPVPVVRPGDASAGVDVERGPVRLHVRRVAGRERVTLVRQPVGSEPDFADPCCLRLDDVVARGGGIRLVEVAEPIDAVGALRVIDLDGDGTDELVGTRSLPPLGDIGYPVETLLFRWDGTRFGAPIVDELPVGSGDTPFLLGDSDGRPGEELGLIATIGRPAFYRVALGPDGALHVEDSGLAPLPAQVMAVPIGGGRGLALMGEDGVLEVRRWPAAAAIEEPLGSTRPLGTSTLVGTADGRDGPLLVARQSGSGDFVRLFLLPDLRAALGDGRRAPASAAIPGDVAPYVGPLRGAGPEGRDALLVSGRLVGGAASIDAPVPVEPFATLHRSRPVGLAGPQAGWLVLHHAPGGAVEDPSGGRLDPPAALPGSALSVTPLRTAAAPPTDGGALEAVLTEALVEGAGHALRVGRGGFTARVEAPPGSRAYVPAREPLGAPSVAVVPEGGTLEVLVPVPEAIAGDARHRLALTVVTPSGHGHVATWVVTVVTRPPDLVAVAETAIGTLEVAVRGTAVGDAVEVRIDGRPVASGDDGSFGASIVAPPWPTDIVVSAADAFGNERRLIVSVVGLFDVRTLPWAAILAVGLAALAVLFVVRAPRAGPSPAPAEEMASLEEID